MKPGQQTTAAGQFQSVKDVENHAKAKMEKVLGGLQHDMSVIRTGRASLSLFENIRVDYYGTPSPLSHVGTLHIPEPSLVTITPYDSTQINLIEKAIRGSDLGLNPSNDGKVVRIPIPALTEERRKDMVKKLHHMAEDHRVSLRNMRRDANEAVKKLVKDKLISEDDERRALDEVQKMTDAYIQKLDVAVKVKEKEVLEIK
ncbi:MAG: ribosome recycling factor [Bryobacterales bacterium]|nr:ribosome recycling factor [Bryobacterales bacterium]